MKYSEKDMAALISEVEDQFADYLTKSEKEEATLQKSETEVKTAVVEENVEKSEEEETTLEKAEFDYDKEDFAEMDKMYSSMNKAEATAHYQSLKKTLFVEDKEEVIEKKEEEKVITKSEKDENTIAKSEYEAVVAKNEELSKSVENLTVAMTNFLKGKSAPKRKAITDIEYVAKSEDTEKDEKNNEDISKLSKNEVAKRLTAKIRSNSLEKSDKDLINNYYLKDNASFDSIKHLL